MTRKYVFTGIKIKEVNASASVIKHAYHKSGIHINLMGVGEVVVYDPHKK